MQIYIVSKPLQLAIASIIAGKSAINATLIVTDMFANAQHVFENLSRSNIWKKVYLVPNRFQSFMLAAMLKPARLVIDGDIGTRLAFYIAMPRILGGCKDIFVYEEGIGTYRNDIYVQGLKKTLMDSLGIATFFGGSWFCKGIYVYHPDKYKKAHNLKSNFLVKSLGYEMQEYTNDNYAHLSELYDFDSDRIGEGKSVKLYISSYNISTDFLDDLISFNEDIVIKLHPQLKENALANNYREYCFIGNQVPAELLICCLASRYENVIVYHHGSSVESYMSYENVDYVRI